MPGRQILLAGFNAFFGHSAGQLNTTGAENSFFGGLAGQRNTTGSSNSFFGRGTGFSNTTGARNSFFGAGAGNSNAAAAENSFFGYVAGGLNTTGFSNSFFGNEAGQSNTTGDSNSFFGSDTGDENTTGSGNSFFGNFAGKANTTGRFNTLIGQSADVGLGNLEFATAIGAGARVTTSNTVTLGRPLDSVYVPGSLTVSGNIMVNDIEANEVVVTAGAFFQNTVHIFGLGADGTNPLCLNDKFQISECGPAAGSNTQRLENALKKQQTKSEDDQKQIKELRDTVNRLEHQINALKQFVCGTNPNAEICKEKQ